MLSRWGQKIAFQAKAVQKFALSPVPHYSRWGLYLQCSVFIICYGCWRVLILDPGDAIAALAVVAVMMTVRQAHFTRGEQVVWVMLAFLIFFAEIRVIHQDRALNEQRQRDDSSRQQQQFANVLGQSQNQFTETMKQFSESNKSQASNFKSVLDQNQRQFTQEQKQFTDNLSTIVTAHKDDEQQFAQVVGREEAMIQAQRDLSTQFAGRLVPGKLPTPPNACTPPGFPAGASGVVGIVGSNAMFADQLPSALIRFNDDPVLQIDKIDNSEDMALHIEMRDQDGKILFRIDKDGLVNRGGFILLRPDPSTILLQDIYGREFMRASLLNSHTVSATGKIVYCGRIEPLDVMNSNGGFGSGNCNAGKFAAIRVEMPFSCPTPPQ